MIKEQFSRTAELIGEEGVITLQNKKVAVIGIGGVGSYAAESLARAGVGNLLLIDSDKVALSNINRQIIALHSTVGLPKVKAAEQRILDINPECSVTALEIFVTPENIKELGLESCDYVIDAVDNVTAKIALAEYSQQAKFPLISAMGTGNKLHPDMFRITDIYNTSVCPLARVMRRELKKRNVAGLKVLYSEEEPLTAGVSDAGKKVPASISFVPSVAGLMLAGEAVREMILR